MDSCSRERGNGSEWRDSENRGPYNQGKTDRSLFSLGFGISVLEPLQRELILAIRAAQNVTRALNISLVNVKNLCRIGAEDVRPKESVFLKILLQ